MFKGFANVWTPVVPSSELRDKPLSVPIAGTPVVFFRGKDQQVGALVDQCPHRGVKLSLGERTEDGCLACPFHGWEFATDGSCAHIPFNNVPEEKRKRYTATALPAKELAGMLWLFTGPDAKGTVPEVPDHLLDPAWARFFYYEDWDTHWTRAMENMLDWPHLPFIHKGTIGRGIRNKMRRDSVMDASFEPAAYGAITRATIDGQPSEGRLDWRKPNGMVLFIDPSLTRGMRMQVYCIPLSEQRTRMLIVSTRTFLRWGPLAWITERVNRKILLEDRSVVESSQPAEVPLASEELSVASDGPTLYFRRYYHRELNPPTGLVPVTRLRTG